MSTFTHRLSAGQVNPATKARRADKTQPRKGGASAAPPPASSPAATTGLAPLLAGLLALTEAHRASAAEGPAAIVLRALCEVAALAQRFAAAPSAWRLASITSSPDAAGLSLLPVEGASRLARTSSPKATQLPPLARTIAPGLLEAFQWLEDARQTAWNVTSDAATGHVDPKECAALESTLKMVSIVLHQIAADATGASKNATTLEIGLTLERLCHQMAAEDEARAAWHPAAE